MNEHAVLMKELAFCPASRARSPPDALPYSHRKDKIINRRGISNFLEITTV